MIEDIKKDSLSNNIEQLPDRVTNRADWLKEYWDENPGELLTMINTLINGLVSTNVSDSGAHNIGFPTSAEIPANNVCEALYSIYAALQGAVLGAGNMPSGGAEGQVLQKTSQADYDAEWAQFSVDAATADSLGTVKPGNGLSVAVDGTLSLSVQSGSLPPDASLGSDGTLYIQTLG